MPQQFDSVPTKTPAPPNAVTMLNEYRATREDYEAYTAWNLAMFLDNGDREGWESAQHWADRAWRASPHYDGRD